MVARECPRYRATQARNVFDFLQVFGAPPACVALPNRHTPARLSHRSAGPVTQGSSMKTVTAALLLAGLAFTTNAAFAATTDDVKWINQCAKDNKGDALRKWC